MCGRFTLTADLEDLRRMFLFAQQADLTYKEIHYRPRAGDPGCDGRQWPKVSFCHAVGPDRPGQGTKDPVIK